MSAQEGEQLEMQQEGGKIGGTERGGRVPSNLNSNAPQKEN